VDVLMVMEVMTTGNYVLSLGHVSPSVAADVPTRGTWWHLVPGGGGRPASPPPVDPRGARAPRGSESAESWSHATN